jgi:CHAT domain-containing protein
MKDLTPASKTVVVLADPVFDSNDERLRGDGTKVAAARPQPSPTRGLVLVNERVKKAAQQTGALHNNLYVARLPGTRQEAAQIAGLVPVAERKVSLDFAASREAMTGAELGRYRYVHIATHGFLDSVQPELSGILLSMVNERGEPQDGFFRAHEVYNLKLSAEMVVLSACETGLGKEIKGEGLVGLTRGFMYAGAPRVVVSLWSVSDAATAELMTRFYRGMLVDKLRPARALQAAQASMLNDKGFAAPFYWAAFTLQGEWR